MDKIIGLKREVTTRFAAQKQVVVSAQFDTFVINIVNALESIGGAIFAPIAGYLKEAQGSYAPAILLFVIVAAIAAVLAVPMEETGKKA